MAGAEHGAGGGGLKYVEIKGIIEIRTESDDPEARFEPVDMLDFQRMCPEIPEDYCYKDYSTGEQNFFYCLVCQCPIKSIKSLDAHTGGKKHIKKAMDKKREELIGFKVPPPNMPKLKERKRASRPLGPPDPRARLADKLRDTEEAVLGLEYITEYISSNPRLHRMYTCDLDGCKSAWGTAEDMTNHVKNAKHQKNYLVHTYPEDVRITGMNSREVMARAEQEEAERNGGPQGRDYELVNQERDEKKYRELYDRPKDWSAKKAKISEATGIPMSASGGNSSTNANHVPLGRRSSSSWSSSSPRHGYGGRSSSSSATLSSITQFPGVDNLFPKPRISSSARAERDGQLLECLADMLKLNSDAMDMLEKTGGARNQDEQSDLARRVPDALKLALSADLRCSKPESRPKIRSMASELKTAARKAEERADGMLAEPALGLKRFRCHYAEIEMDSLAASMATSRSIGEPTSAAKWSSGGDAGSSSNNVVVVSVDDLEPRLDVLTSELKALGLRGGGGAGGAAAMETEEREAVAEGIEEVRKRLQEVRVRQAEKVKKQEDKKKLVDVDDDVVLVSDDNDNHVSMEVSRADAEKEVERDLRYYISELVEGRIRTSRFSREEADHFRRQGDRWAGRIARKEAQHHKARGKPWADFKLNRTIKDNVKEYVERKMK